MQSAGCRLCRIAREARGESTDSLADETHGHINSASCEGKATTVTTAHHSICRHLYDSLHAAQKPKSKLKFVTLDKESNMSTLWRREEFLRICSKDELAEKAQDIEVMNFALRYGGNRTHAGANPGLIRSQTKTTRPTVYIRLVPNVPVASHVMGTFGTNRIYTVGRVVKVEDLVR